MDTLKENMIDRAFLESEEWFDLVVKTFDSAARTRDSEKISLYSRIIRNSVIQSNRKTHDPEEYLMVLSELTPREVKLAKAIYAQQKDGQKENENELLWVYGKGWKNLAAEAGLDGNDLVFLLKRLERTGLIKEITGTYLDYEGGVYVITEVFRKLMNYLEEDT
jgi:DNA-binding MarR family transcriptional regulator